MAEYATNGKASAGVALGSVGTALGGLAVLNNGLLGNLLGGGNQAMGVIAQKDAEIAELKAQKYSDAQDVNLYQATRSENKELWNNVKEALVPIATKTEDTATKVATLECRVSKNEEIAALREELVKSQLGAKIDAVACQASNGINMLNSAVSGINNTLNGIICNKVQLSAICPEPMPRWNSWTAPATGESAPATQPVTGSINVRQI